MILPEHPDERHAKFRDMIRDCEMNSRETRRSEAETLARWAEQGGDEPAEYNMLDEKVATSSALVFDPQAVRIEVQLPKHYGHHFIDELDAARDDLEDSIDADLAVLATAVRYAHIWPSSFVKVFGRGDDLQVGMLADPSDFGTAHEDLDTIDEVPYFTHWYTMTISQFERRVAGHPKYTALMRAVMEHVTAPDRQKSATLPATLEISASSPTMIGRVTQYPSPRGQAVVRQPVVKLAELWWRDSRIDDWRMATQFVPTLDIVWETKDNPLGIKGEHPIRQCCLLPKPGYLYGLSLLDKIIPLQRRLTETLHNIWNIYDLNYDPPLLQEGFPGVLDEKGERFMKKGGRASTPMPGATVKPMNPPLPPDVFGPLDRIDMMAARMWGLPLVHSAGEMQPNVRGAEQQGEAAGLGSAVLRERAGRVVDFVGSVLTLKLRMRQKELAKALYTEGKTEQDESLEMDGGERILLSLLPTELGVRVWGHSASPVARREIESKAVILKREQAIDAPMMARLFTMPFADKIEKEAKAMAKAAAQYKGIALQLKKKEMDAKMVSAQARAAKA